MRLWSIHPRYLDCSGLVGLWREGLLAQRVLLGRTKGYKNHPQLDRFKEYPDPVCAISSYLGYVCDEADSRMYNFNRGLIEKNVKINACMSVSDGQVNFERKHLLEKLAGRDVERYARYNGMVDFDVHPMFCIENGPIEIWEKIYD